VEDASVEAHTDPTRRGRSVIAWTIAGLSVAVMATSPAIKIVSGTLFGADDTAIILPGLLGGLAFAVVGALIAARTGNAVGWVFLGIAASFAISIPAQNWVDVAIEDGRPVAFLGVANWLSQWPFFVCLGLLPAVFFLFPTGRLPSRRWKIPWRVYLAALVVTVVGFALLPYRWDGVEGVIVTNPVGIPSAAEPVVGGLLAVAGLLLVASAFVALASLIVRARGADPETRQQIRWLGAVGRVGGVLFALTLAAGIASGNRETGFAAAAADVLMVLLVVTIVVGLPAATALAIFRFRLFDLDLVVKKTVQYGVLVALFVAVGLLVVVAIPTAIVEVGGTSEALPVLVLAAVLAGAFLWLRPRAARLADRIVFGGRATPYEVLTEFSDRVGETYAADDVLPRMASVLGEGTGAATATVWLQLGGRLRPDATWPPAAEAPVSPPPGSVDVTHRGERLGALSVTMPPDDPMDPSKERLLRDLAAQAGLVLRNVRLIEELRAGRRAAEARARHPRRRPAAARGAQRAAGAAGHDRCAGPGARRDDRHRPPGDGDRDARGPPRPGPRHLPAVARRPGARGGDRRSGPQGDRADRRRGVGGRPVRPGGRGRRVLQRARGDEQRREVRACQDDDDLPRPAQRFPRVPRRG
jgi:hypothetical protein